MKMGKAGENGENAEHGRAWVAGKYAKRADLRDKEHNDKSQQLPGPFNKNVN